MIDRRETVAQMRRRLNRGPRECTVCGEEMPARRRSFCSDACMLLKDWPAARNAALNRDKCVCHICGFDSNALRRIWRHLDWITKRHLSGELAVIGFDGFGRNYGAGLNVDHIVPVADGGTHAQDNLRTLCIPCHKQVTREWHGLNSQRKLEKV